MEHEKKKLKYNSNAITNVVLEAAMKKTKYGIVKK